MTEIRITLDDDTLERIAERVAPLIDGQRQSDPERWLDVKQAAQHLACPPSRIYALVSAGRIPHSKDGSRVLFKASELDDWVRTGGGKRP